MSIVLSDGTKDRTLTLVRTDGDWQVFQEEVGPLVGRLQLRVRNSDNAAGTVIRQRLILSRADVAPSTADGLDAIRYEEVYSIDNTVVKRGTAAGREAMYELQKSLAASSAMSALMQDNVRPV